MQGVSDESSQFFVSIWQGKLADGYEPMFGKSALPLGFSIMEEADVFAEILILHIPNIKPIQRSEGPGVFIGIETMRTFLVPCP
jgi:hypothetical protein